MIQSIILSHIFKFAHSKEILTDLSVQLNPGEKYGLIGPNGCGKTTLFNIISNRDSDYEGNIQGTQNIIIGYVQQNPVHEDNLLVKEVFLYEYRDIIHSLRKAEQAMAESGCAESEDILNEYQEARDLYDRVGIDEIIIRMESTLDALGLPGKLNQPVSTLSGGEKNILNMAIALARQPDLLLLDEPDNHLDFPGMAWFEEFLKNYKKMVILVSHNRYLIDRVCSRILEIENCNLTEYKGNYSTYRMEKLKKQTARQADYAANQRRLEQLEKLVKRFEEIARRTADPAWGKRLRARKKQLGREQSRAVENPQTATKRIRVVLDTIAPKADIALSLKEYSRTLGNTVLFKNTGLKMSCGDKVGLVGPNGCGKTTLIKDIIQYGDWDHPHIRVAPSLQIGYMAQQQKIFKPHNTIEDEIRSLGPLTRNDAFRILSRFLFTWQDLDKKVSTLSGGEINRLQLARLTYLRPNFLILDEPTNHLDIPSREVVEDAICSFEGTLLVVSHDRYFLDKVVNRIVEVKEHQLVSHSLSFSEYWLLTFNQVKKSKGRLTTRGAEKQQKKKEMDSKRNNYRVAELEKQIANAEDEKKKLEREITRMFGQGNHQEGRKLASRLERLVRHIEKLYAEWEYFF
jgi:ATP-binding cassette subfamily F protein 3